jgi:23S rRNA (adenine2503-C2)-methyltransferase
MSKSLIKNLSLDEVAEYFASVGEKPYRARQLFNWLYERNITSFHEMTDFTKVLRRRLDEEFILSPLELEDRVVSAVDATEKYLFRTLDGKYIESVLIKKDGSDDGRLTICVSSQIGCAMGCTFCETARLGFTRNLETAEILDQVNQVRRISGLSTTISSSWAWGSPF